MAPSRFRFTISALLVFVACVALNIWLFRLGALWGILGLNVTKHVVIALLCQNLGVDRPVAPKTPGGAARTHGRIRRTLTIGAGARIRVDHPQ
jgi:hypothetical protein